MHIPSGALFQTLCLILLAQLFSPMAVTAAERTVFNQILRVEIKQIRQITRINISCDHEPVYMARELPGSVSESGSPILAGHCLNQKEGILTAISAGFCFAALEAIQC